MLESLASTIARSRFVKSAFGLVNRMRLPFSRLPVNVHGHAMTAHTFDRYLALWLWKFRVLGRAEASLLSEACKPGMCVLDIGANIGLYSMLMARSVGSGGRVIAFEPGPGNHSMLLGNLAKNGYRNVTAVPRAVGEKTTTGSLYRSSFHCDHRVYLSDAAQDAIPVEVVALDDHFPAGQRIDLIKMDIQGAEGMALRGMRRILRSNPQVVIVMEFWPDGLRQAGDDPVKILEELRCLGFQLENVAEKAGVRADIADIEAFVESLGDHRYTNVLATPKAGRS